jgi:hypothetical protein
MLEENDKLRDEFDCVREDDIAGRERLEVLSAALKDVRAFSFRGLFLRVYAFMVYRNSRW